VRIITDWNHLENDIVDAPSSKALQERSGMLSPRTGLGLEAQKIGLGLDLNGNGNGLGLDPGLGLDLDLETMRPRPRVIRPRGLVHCNVLISYSVVNNCQY